MKAKTTIKFTGAAPERAKARSQQRVVSRRKKEFETWHFKFYGKKIIITYV